MRRLLSSVAAISLLAFQQAHAQLDCLGGQDRSIVQVAALRSELMVLATGCHQDDAYNAFIRKFQPSLMSNEREVGDMFKRMYGKRGQQEHDRFTTDLANGESNAGVNLGSDFCGRNSMLFSEVMALPSSTELPQYAAGKDLVPTSLDVCPQVAMAPTHKATVTRKHH
jgi:hypothetical protein